MAGPYRDIFPEVLDRMAGHARIDYGFHLAPMTSEHIAEIPVDARAAGRISVCLHCEQAELLRVFIERAKADPRVSGLAEYSAARPPLTEAVD